MQVALPRTLACLTSDSTFCSTDIDVGDVPTGLLVAVGGNGEVQNSSDVLFCL